MKFLISTIVLAAVNIAIMLMFAASKFGRTPDWLPLILSLLSLGGVIFFFVKYLKTKTDKLPLALSSVICLVLVIFNLFMLQTLMYVS